MPELDDEPSSCSVCEHSEDDCTCYTCPSCDEQTDGEQSSQCSRCDRCGDCCECSHCVYDGEAVESVCSRCDRCPDHCDDVTCDNCDSRVEHTCSNCSGCDGCCECSYCDGCDSTVSELECSDCRRCEDCGCSCSCSSEEEGDEEGAEPAVADEFQPLCTRLGRAGSCTRREGCYYCADVDGRTLHRFHNIAGNPDHTLCGNCDSCLTHCRAVQAECGHKAHDKCSNCNKCKDYGCCTCAWCSGGYTYTIHIIAEGIAGRCEGCHYCKEHCTCPKCRTCQVQGAPCRWCKQCKTCCTKDDSQCHAFGRPDKPIPTGEQPLKLHKPTKLQRKRLPNDRLIGTEIEINGCTQSTKARKLSEALLKWGDSVVRDGSIGDGWNAFEINAMPSAGDLFLEHIEELCAGLEDMGAKPNDHCGIHVHIDVSDFAYYDLKKLIEVYRRTERALFDMCHPRRLNGQYSQVCGTVLDAKEKSPKVFKEKLISNLYFAGGSIPKAQKPVSKLPKSYKEAFHNQNKMLGPNMRKRYERKYNETRYRALNVHSYFLRGTVEFRHHEGGIDPKIITGWAMTCQELVTAANRMSNAQIEALPRNPRKALEAIMPSRLHEEIRAAWNRNDSIINKDTANGGFNGWANNRKQIWGI